MKEKMMKAIEDAVRKLGGVWPVTSALMGAHGVPCRIEKGVLYYRWGDSVFVSQGYCANGFFIGTREEFDECASRLRNEPSFDDAPDWAVAKAQDSDGEWYWYSTKPTVGLSAFKTTSKSYYASKGEVIGDWRDTLRLKSEEKKEMKNEKQMNASEAVYGFASWLTCRKDKVCFSSTDDAGIAADLVKEFCSANALPEISDKWPNNLVHPEDKNDWHERGEFPPVGTECLINIHNTKVKVLIIGVDAHTLNIVMAQPHGTVRYFAPKSNPSDFSPLQTERERLFEKAFDVLNGAETTGTSIGRLIDEGMLKMPGEK